MNWAVDITGLKVMTYRISKYNPKNRIDGVYTVDEWTDYSDIGMIFDGKVFTEQEYLEMENRYINCILDIYKICAIDAVEITDLEIYDSVLWNGNDYVTYDNMNKIICDCLRNKCWCKLEQKDFLSILDMIIMYI